MDYRAKLKEIGLVLIQEEPAYLELSEAISDYKDLLNILTPYDIVETKFLENVNSKGGKAIGTRWAALCLEDIFRTQTFVKGIYEAIVSLSSHSEKPISLLYAGTGPYATLILPLLPFFTPDQLKLGLIEINPLSFDMVKNLFEKLELESYVSQYYLEDAVTIKFQKSEHYNLILSETMQNGLRDEPQVAIISNLLKQFPDAIIIPERISIGVGFYTSLIASTDQVLPAKIDIVKEVFALDKDFAFSINEQDNFEIVKFDCKSENFSDHHYCCIFTEIQVFKKYQLLTNESGLTVPIILFPLKPEKSEITAITFQYEMGGNPGLKMTYIRS